MRSELSDLQLMGDVLARHRNGRRRPIPLVLFDRTMRSTDMHQVGSAIGPIFVFFSEEAAVQACAGVHWHDDAGHCRTWTEGGGCACDVEGVDCSPPKDPPPAVFVLDLRIGPNGVELKGAPRLPTPGEAAQLQQTPAVANGPPVVLSTRLELAPAPAPCTCVACQSRAAAAVFGGPGKVTA